MSSSMAPVSFAETFPLADFVLFIHRTDRMVPFTRRGLRVVCDLASRSSRLPIKALLPVHGSTEARDSSDIGVGVFCIRGLAVP